MACEVTELLAGASLFRYSTTIALNALLQRAGPRLGLITTRGHEDMLFIGNGRAWGDGLPVNEQRRVAQAQMFLEGRDQQLAELVEQRMQAASERQEYESAARYRDMLVSLRKLSEKQRMTSVGLEAVDFWA